MSGNDRIVIINGMKFKDVTNQTVIGTVYNYEEAVALSRGKHIITSGKKEQTDEKS